MVFFFPIPGLAKRGFALSAPIPRPPLPSSCLIMAVTRLVMRSEKATGGRCRR